MVSEHDDIGVLIVHKVGLCSRTDLRTVGPVDVVGVSDESTFVGFISEYLVGTYLLRDVEITDRIERDVAANIRLHLIEQFILRFGLDTTRYLVVGMDIVYKRMIPQIVWCLVIHQRYPNSIFN
jgi:hypothetical protein